MQNRNRSAGTLRHVGAGLAALALLAAGCVQHIGDYEPKRRQYKSPVDFEKAAGPSEAGSLFHHGYTGTYLFADQRAMRIGDIVTIRIREEADAKRGASTDLSRKSDTAVQLQNFFGLLKDIGDENGELIQAMLGSDFSGRGTTARSEHLEATIPSTVREVLPNGNLFVEGHRVILVNNEEHHFYISGVVRPVDIKGDNSVESSLVADAEIEFTGRGVVSEKQSPGWLQRALDFAAPF